MQRYADLPDHDARAEFALLDEAGAGYAEHEPSADLYASWELERRHARTELMIRRALESGESEA